MEVIYYSQHCNLWECNEQNMWIPTNKKMMIYNRQKNNQEQDAHNYMNILNKIWNKYIQQKIDELH